MNEEQTSRLSDMLTLVITTSPVVSHPSPALLFTVLQSLEHVPDLWECPKVIICDGCTVLANPERSHECDLTTLEDVPSGICGPGCDSRRRNTYGKYQTISKAMRSGFVDADHFHRYQAFKDNLLRQCASQVALSWHPLKAPLAGVKVKCMDLRLGYGYLLREALLPEHGLVNTKYICVIQHDRTFLRHVPIANIVSAMEASSAWDPNQTNPSGEQLVKIVGFSTRSNVNYLRRVEGRPTVYRNDFDISRLAWEPPQLQIQGTDVMRPIFVPLLQFYDSTHIALTQHYRDFIFDPKLRLVKRGGFVEDRLSQALMESMRRKGFVMGHRPFGCYLYEDGLCRTTAGDLQQHDNSSGSHSSVETTAFSSKSVSSRIFTGHIGHLDGGSFIARD